MQFNRWLNWSTLNDFKRTLHQRPPPTFELFNISSSNIKPGISMNWHDHWRNLHGTQLLQRNLRKHLWELRGGVIQYFTRPQQLWIENIMQLFYSKIWTNLHVYYRHSHTIIFPKIKFSHLFDALIFDKIKFAYFKFINFWGRLERHCDISPQTVFEMPQVWVSCKL